jgi:predicted MFS family arabinose efflux permease
LVNRGTDLSHDRASINGTRHAAGGAVSAEVFTPLWVVFGLAMGPTVALGLARFAYALLLPPMRADLGWSFADAGAMNTANAAGYLIGALTAALIGRRLGDKRVFATALLLTALAVGASGLTGRFEILLVLRLVAGLTGALAFVMGAGLTSAAAVGGAQGRAPTVLAVYFAGGGIGIAASALAVPPLLASSGWRAGWLVMGALSLAATGYAWVVLPRVPNAAAATTGRAREGWSPRFMSATLFAYALFGAGYSSYSTFIIAYLRGDEKLSGHAVSVFWAVLGLSAVAAAFAWGPLLGRLKRGWGTAVAVGTVAVGAAVPLVFHGVGGAYVSAALFGGSFLAVIAAVTAFARKTAQPHAWTAAIAALTTTFGIGQCIGPILSGALSDGPNGVRGGLWLSVGILVAACIVATLQREFQVTSSAGI